MTSALLSGMHASLQGLAQNNARWPASTNPMHARFTCVVLQPLPAQALRQELEANPSAAKEHKGARFVGCILQGEPGWTSTGSPADAAGGGKDKGGKKGPPPARGEKLSRQQGEVVLMHSYDLKNKGGSYYKDRRSDQFAAIAPGMIISIRIFGDQLLKVLEQQHVDLHVFDVVHVELSMKSMQSTAGELKLDIKRMYPVSDGERLLCGWTRAPGTVEQSSEHLNTHFLAGQGLLPEDVLPNLDQSMVKGNLSQTVHLLRVPVGQTQGRFAVHADGQLRFHVQGQLRDLNASLLLVHAHARHYGNPPLEWLCTLFNVALKLPGVVHLLVALDTYRTARLSASDVQLDAAVQLNMEALLRAAEEQGQRELPAPVASTFEAQGMQSALRYLHCLYAQEDDDLFLVLDTRKVNRKVGAIVDGDTWTTPTLSLAHTSAKWSQAHSLYVFLKGAPVLNMAFNLSVGGVDFAAQAPMQAISLAPLEGDPSLEFEPEPPAPPAKRSKKAEAPQA